MPDASEVDFPFFGDKTYRLRFDYDAWMELETRTSKTPLQFVGSITQLSAVDLRTALWVGLKWQEANVNVRKTITLDWVGKQLQLRMKRRESNMPLLRALDEAFAASGYFTPEQPDDGSPLVDPTKGEASSDSPRRPTLVSE